MYQFLLNIYAHDPGGMQIISIPLFFVGLRLVHRYPKIHALCSMLALITGAALIVQHYVFGPLEKGMAFPRLAFNALMTCWFVIGPYWIAGFFVGLFGQYIFSPLYRGWKNQRNKWKQFLTERRRQADLRRAALLREQEDRRLEPERERQRRLAQEAKDATEHRKERRRCMLMKFRSTCEFFYTQHIPEIMKRLPREEFDRLLERYLGESVPTELVEENGVKILDLLKQHAARTESNAALDGLSGMLRSFRREKENIESLNLPPDEEEVVMANLDSRMAELQDEFIRKMTFGSSR